MGKKLNIEVNKQLNLLVFRYELIMACTVHWILLNLELQDSQLYSQFSAKESSPVLCLTINSTKIISAEVILASNVLTL